MMRTAWLFVALAVIVVICAPAGAADFPEQWFRFGGSIVEPEGADKCIALMERAKKAGYTHVLLDDVYLQTYRAMPQKYLENSARVKKAAEEFGLILVPNIFNVGYSWRVLWYDSNLAAGLPVENAPFVVANGQALPDPAAVPKIVNGGFEANEEDKVEAWQPEGQAHLCVTADREARHSGLSSLKMTGFDALPRETRGACQVSQKVAVEPFKYYRVTIWRKTQDLDATASNLFIRSSDGKRRLCYTNLEVDPIDDLNDYVAADSDWTQFQLSFNTLETTEMIVGVGLERARSGTVWWDDLKIEPAGLANVLRRPAKPFVVTSTDGGTVYEEGRDFRYVADPLMGKAPMPDFLSYLPPGGSFDIWHEGPPIRLTANSSIEDGETLLVSYFHPHIIYGHQVTGSLTDPKVFEIFEEQMQWMKKVWDAPAYFMAYDEIRTAGWEKQPAGAERTTAQLLANHVSRAVEIAHKYAPDTKLYIWSDMFDPEHNARSRPDKHGYYLCNGDFHGSWEGLPSEVSILKWASSNPRSIRFAAERGHKIVFSGNSEHRIKRWMNAAEGTGAEILGFCYTDWHKNYDPLESYAEAIRALPQPAE